MLELFKQIEVIAWVELSEKGENCSNAIYKAINVSESIVFHYYIKINL